MIDSYTLFAPETFSLAVSSLDGNQPLAEEICADVLEANLADPRFAAADPAEQRDRLLSAIAARCITATRTLSAGRKAP